MKISNACNEYNNISRRGFLKGTGKLAIAAGAMSALLPKVALAQGSNSDRDIILQLYLRGGCDGLSMLAPFGEDSYYSFRPTIAIPRPDSSSDRKAIDLDGFFGISQSMGPLMAVYNEGHLLFVHATGMSHSSRSHFDNMRWMETGYIDSISDGTGWLGRHLSTTAPIRSENTLRGVALGYAVPLTLAGGPGTAAVENLGQYGVVGSNKFQQKSREETLRTLYATDKDRELRAASMAVLDTVNLLRDIRFDSYVPADSAVYPASQLGYAMKSAAALIRSDVGVEAMTIDVGGWDTHSDAGTNYGWLYLLLGDLAASMAAFHQDLVGANRFGRTIVVVMSEFGRTARENASFGTDHGTGSAMMIMGGGVQGGRVLADWPGFRSADLYEGQDLPITIDYRDLLAEIVSKRLSNAENLGEVFPNYTPTFRDIVA
jgi:uncharacterized protein (DUF1501 family)